MVDLEKGKRELIIEAAIKIFVKKGFQDSKVEEIAQEAMVGKGTVYEYFSSKKELFQEMVKYILEHYTQRQRETGTSITGSAQEKLMGIALEHVDFHNKNQEMAQVLNQDFSWIGPDFTAYLVKILQEMQQLIQDILQQGVAAGEFEEMDCHLVATAFIGMMDGVCSPAFIENTELDTQETAAKMIKIIVEGIKKR